MAYNDIPQDHPMFKNGVVEQEGAGRMFVSADFKNMRTMPIFWHLRYRAGNGLSAVKFRQIGKDGVMLIGGDESFSEGVMKGAGLDEFCWRRGQSPLFAPAELTYLEKRVVFEIVEGHYEDDGTFTSANCFSKADMGAMITLRSSRPMNIKVGKVCEFPRKIRRERCLASSSLEACRRIAARDVSTHCEPFPMSLSAPPLRVAPDSAPAQYVAATKTGSLAPSPKPQSSKGPTVAVRFEDGVARVRPAAARAVVPSSGGGTGVVQETVLSSPAAGLEASEEGEGSGAVEGTAAAAPPST